MGTGQARVMRESLSPLQTRLVDRHTACDGQQKPNMSISNNCQTLRQENDRYVGKVIE